MNIWPNHTSFTSEEIVMYSEIFQRDIFTHESFPDEHAYFAQLISDNS